MGTHLNVYPFKPHLAEGGARAHTPYSGHQGIQVTRGTSQGSRKALRPNFVSLGSFLVVMLRLDSSLISLGSSWLFPGLFLVPPGLLLALAESPPGPFLICLGWFLVFIPWV